MGPLCDLLWSDPQDEFGWRESNRGAGYQFGPNITNKFITTNSVDLIIRAHELVFQVFDVCLLDYEVGL